MKRTLSIILATALCIFAGCSGGDTKDSPVVSGSGVVEFTSSSSREPPTLPESPAAVEGGSQVTPSSAQSSQAEPSSEPSSEPLGSKPESTPTAIKPAPDEVRSVWVSYLELAGLMTGKSSTDYRANVAEVFATCAEFGLNTVVLQVRPFADAIYPSKHFPQSYLFTGTEGGVGEAPYDALQIAIEEAHKQGLRLEAWINPYRIRNAGGKALGKDNPAHELLASGDAVKMGEVITYNPASKRAQKLITDGVAELVTKYEVDAIHFDDYFYPTTDEAFDSVQYGEYKASGGTKDLAGWRRSNVTALVRMVHDTIKTLKPSVLFGISPQGNMGNNMNVQYVDLAEITRENLIDYICPQMYFGFLNSGCPFRSVTEDFNRMVQGTEVKLYVGLATYKFNKVDTWAGDGKNEWIGTTDLLKRQTESARSLSQYGGFVLYRYDSSFRLPAFYSGDATARAQAQKEMTNLKGILK